MPSAVRQSFAELLVPEADDLGRLTKGEIWWRNCVRWLELEPYAGYVLPPRFRQDWRPSWKEHPKRHPSEFEDWYRYENANIVDAIRLKDKRHVALKRIDLTTARGMNEVEVVNWLYSPDRGDPDNHTVPLLEQLLEDDQKILVMPFLRQCDDPAWDTVGEVMSFLKQVFEGVAYMHRMSVAHREIKAASIMYDPTNLYPDGYHPIVRDKRSDLKGIAKRRTRTDCPVTYYFVGFGSAKRYWDVTRRPREFHRNMTVHEVLQLDDRPSDPFMDDIRCLGQMVRTVILMKYRRVSFLAPLVKDMLQESASKRPTAADVVRRFNSLQGALTERQLRARLVPVYEGTLLGLCRNIRHTFRMLRWKCRDKVAVPLPPEP